MRRSLCSIALLVGAAAPLASARAAEPGAVDFAWAREEGASLCPDGSRIAAHVTRRLGRDPFAPGARRRIRGVVARRGDGFRVRIEEHDGDRLVGARELPFEGLDCAAVDDVSVLVIALLIDPDAALGARLPGPPVAPPPVAPPSLGAPPLSPLVLGSAPPATRAAPAAWARPQDPIEDAPAALRAGIFARGGAGFGLGPAPVPVLALAAGVGGRFFEGTVGMLWVPEARTGDGAFAFGLTAGSLGACLSPLRFARGSAVVCGGIAAGAVHAVVRALDRYEPLRPGQRFWAAATLTPRLRLTVAGPLAFELGADLFAPLTRYRFTASARPIYEASPVAAVSFAGLGLSIP